MNGRAPKDGTIQSVNIHFGSDTSALDRLFHALCKDIGLCGGRDIGFVRPGPHDNNQVCILRKTNVSDKCL